MYLMLFAWLVNHYVSLHSFSQHHISILFQNLHVRQKSLDLFPALLKIIQALNDRADIFTSLCMILIFYDYFFL